MIKKLKLYFDTSVFNFAFADDTPERKDLTIKLLEEVKVNKYDVYISTVVLREIHEAPREKAKKLMNLINEVQPFELLFDRDSYELAYEYIKRGIIPSKYEDDAFHIAVASVNDLDAIISWNFKHIVKLKTKKEVFGTNLLMGYKEIEIYSPMEVVEND
ncbi:MAG: PIN domain-containing protein [Candidatus Brocadiaceae bacterium]|nr:PIN domain-containing protein [Candidatus Brocadiaceae bacterium]